MNPPTSFSKASTNLLYFCMIFSWPLAVLGKLIPVPEIPITEYLQTLCYRRRHEGFILQKNLFTITIEQFATKMLLPLAEKAEENSNEHP